MDSYLTTDRLTLRRFTVGGQGSCSSSTATRG